MAAEVSALTGFGAVGGPRGLGDTGGGTRCLGSVQRKNIGLFLCYWTGLCWSVRGQLCSRLTWTLRCLHSFRPGDGDPAGRRWGVGLSLPQVDGGRFGRHRGLQRLPGLHPLAGLLAELRPLGGLGRGPPPQDHAAVLLWLSAGVWLLIALIRLLRRARFPAYGVRACCHGNNSGSPRRRRVGFGRERPWFPPERRCAVRDVRRGGGAHGGTGARLWPLQNLFPW